MTNRNQKSDNEPPIVIFHWSFVICHLFCQVSLCVLRVSAVRFLGCGWAALWSLMISHSPLTLRQSSFVTLRRGLPRQISQAISAYMGRYSTSKTHVGSYTGR